MNPGESLGLGCRLGGNAARVCAAVVAIDRFSAFGATAQPANIRVNSATTVRLTRFSIMFFMAQRYRRKQIPIVTRVRDFPVLLLR